MSENFFEKVIQVQSGTSGFRDIRTERGHCPVIEENWSAGQRQLSQSLAEAANETGDFFLFDLTCSCEKYPHK